MELKDLQNMIEGDAYEINKLPKQKHMIVNLPESCEAIDVCVLSNVNIGLVGPHTNTSKVDKPFRINKFKAHIAELAKNPNAKVFLGGDLFYFPVGGKTARDNYCPSYNDQVDVMAELLQPIKNKIIAGYDGTDEVKIFEKDGRKLTQELMAKLGLRDRYCGQMAEVDFVFKNKLTGNTSRSVNMLFDHGFLTANALSTVAKKTSGLQQKTNGKDFYITSHYNKLFIKKDSILKADHGTHMIKVPCYFVSVGGYRDFANRLSSNRNTSPANTNNGMIRIFVVPNPDKNNIRGNNYLGEPQYKICQEFVNFGRTNPHEFNFELIKEIAEISEENILCRDFVVQKIKERIGQLNQETALELLTKKYYRQQDKQAKEELDLINNRLIKTTKKPYVIDETDIKGEERC